MTGTLPQAPPRQRPPGPRLPEILGPWETLLLAWRRLRRMSTALMLLFAMAAASVVATFIPQEPVVPRTVADWRLGEAGPGAAVSDVFDAVGLYDVFGSWWFAALTALLFISLTGCLVPRYHAFWRAARRPPAAGRNLERLSNHVVITTPMAPDAALAAVERELAGRGRRFRRRRLGPDQTASGLSQLAAESGHRREGGSLVFHTAFYVLLVGIVVGHGFGFTGQVNVVEGSTLTDTRIQYDLAEPGRWFGLDDHSGTQLRLDDFDVAYFDDATPRHFRSTITVLEGGERVRRATIEVNHPLSHAGIDVYQLRFGMAPHLVVRGGDRLVFDEQVMLSSAGGGMWRGQAKIRTAHPQILLDMVLVPDAAVGENARGQPDIVNLGPEPNNPVLFADLWIGELGLERALPASEFLREGGERVSTVMAREGERVELMPDGLGLGDVDLSLAFEELTMWSGFQISHAPGRSILLAAAGLILVGLLPSLYSYRRRIWAEARPNGDGSEVVLAGVALQRKQVFAQEFDRLARRVRDTLGDLTARQEIRS